MASPDGAKTKLMDAKKLLTAIEKAGFATANDELRPVMNGVRFEFFADGMVAVASDGHKLAKYKDLTITYDNSEDQTVYGFTMPKKPCSTLLNVLGSTVAGDIKVMFNDRCFTVNNTQFKMSARLIEGRYPNYDSVIPKDNDRIVTIAKNDFVAAMKRVLPMGNANSELVALSFSMGMMTISAEDFDFSKSASENVGCDYAQEEFTIGFKGSTLLQLLQNIDTDNVKVMLKDPSRAGVLCEDKPNGVYEYTSLIMPMLIQND
jgi:DNA polymerase-3 subunit beta